VFFSTTNLKEKTMARKAADITFNLADISDRKMNEIVKKVLSNKKADSALKSMMRSVVRSALKSSIKSVQRMPRK
jgi:hypothetical protein